MSDSFTKEQFQEIVGRWERSSQKRNALTADLGRPYSSEELTTSLREIGATDSEIAEQLAAFVAELPPPAAELAPAPPIASPGVVPAPTTLPAATAAAAPSCSVVQPAAVPSYSSGGSFPFRLLGKGIALPAIMLGVFSSLAPHLIPAAGASSPAMPWDGILHAFTAAGKPMALFGIAVGGLAMLFSED